MRQVEGRRREKEHGRNSSRTVFKTGAKHSTVWNNGLRGYENDCLSGYSCEGGNVNFSAYVPERCLNYTLEAVDLKQHNQDASGSKRTRDHWEAKRT